MAAPLDGADIHTHIYIYIYIYIYMRVYVFSDYYYHQGIVASVLGLHLYTGQGPTVDPMKGVMYNNSAIK